MMEEGGWFQNGSSEGKYFHEAARESGEESPGLACAGRVSMGASWIDVRSMEDVQERLTGRRRPTSTPC